MISFSFRLVSDQSLIGSGVARVFPNDDAIVRLCGAILLKQIDEWNVQPARCMTLETIAQMSDDIAAMWSAVPAA